MYDTLKYNSFCRKTLKYDTFCRETLKYGTFCRKNLDYALRAKKMANLRNEPTPHFMLLCSVAHHKVEKLSYFVGCGWVFWVWWVCLGDG